jgi:hypothetical protein
MSFSFNVKGANGGEVFASLATKVAEYNRPQAEVDRIMGAATAIVAGMPEESVRSIETYGHFNADGSGNFKMSVNC